MFICVGGYHLTSLINPILLRELLGAMLLASRITLSLSDFAHVLLVFVSVRRRSRATSLARCDFRTI